MEAHTQASIRPVASEFERAVSLELQRIFDLRCKGHFTDAKAFREAVRRVKAGQLFNPIAA